MSARLNGKVAIVTGAGSGIGKTLAMRLAREVGKDGITVNALAPSRSRRGC